MRCRPARLLAIAIAFSLLASPAAAAPSLLIQNMDTAAYPTVTFTMVLPPSSIPTGGTLPSVSIVENGAPITDVVVTSLVDERGPIDVVLLLDTSGSMKGRPLADAKSAALRFVDSMKADDRIAIVAFSSQPEVVQGFTSDRQALEGKISGLAATGSTALYDGLVEAASLAGRSSAGQRYVVALSDSKDTMSINSPDNATRALKRAKVPLYAVALGSSTYKTSTLATMARASGGRMTTAKGTAILSSIYQSIAEELQSQYRIEYRSTRPSTPELDILVRLGAGLEAPTARATARNPLFDASAAGMPATMLGGTPDAGAMGLALLLAFGCVALLVFAVGTIFSRDRAALEQLRYYDQLHSSGTLDEAEHDQGTSRGRVLNLLGEIAERHGFTGLVQRRLEAAGLALRANEYMLLHVLVTALGGLGVYVFSGGQWFLSVAVVIIIAIAPIALLQVRASRRRAALEEQLPDLLNLIAGSLRSGWGIQQAIDLVVDEVGDPARAEFRRVQAEARLGLPLEEALHRMAERVDSDDLRWTVSAITIQREVGGNLAEVLNTVAFTIRERAELMRGVKVLTAESRFSALVLTVMPFVVFALMFAANPSYALPLIQTSLGLAALAVGGLLLIIGVVWLNRVMKIEV
jgi:tight adherence protein B